MRPGKESFIVCPIDGHECTLPQCQEYEGTKEQPCEASVRALAKAYIQISKINYALSVYEDAYNQTFDELNNSINIDDTILDVSERLGIDLATLVDEVCAETDLILDKKEKQENQANRKLFSGSLMKLIRNGKCK